jgi:hypothetical protein
MFTMTREAATRNLAGALMMCLAGLGCSGKTGPAVFPVQGQVLFKGEPAAGALVVFHPINQLEPDKGKPRATVEEDGSFKVTTYTAWDGAPAGDYAVSITWARKAVQPPGGKGHPKKVPTHFPRRYEDPNTSGLVVHIEEKANELLPFALSE